eukprot:3453762-Amphidinium_carterae.1
MRSTTWITFSDPVVLQAVQELAQASWECPLVIQGCQGDMLSHDPLVTRLEDVEGWSELAKYGK